MVFELGCVTKATQLEMSAATSCTALSYIVVDKLCSVIELNCVPFYNRLLCFHCARRTLSAANETLYWHDESNSSSSD